MISCFQVRGLVFEAGASLGALAATVGAACRRLTDANVPHNLFIVDRGARVFLLPNAFAERKVCDSVVHQLLVQAICCSRSSLLCSRGCTGCLSCYPSWILVHLLLILLSPASAGGSLCIDPPCVVFRFDSLPAPCLSQ